MSAADDQLDGQPDADVLASAPKVFDLAREGDITALLAYLDAGFPVGLANEGEDSLLMLAAYHGHADVVAALIERGADPNQGNDRGQTPLAGVVFKNHEAVARLLVDAGADPTAGFPSAIEAARMFGRDQLLALFDAVGEAP
jgi:uncharacterized protein